MRKAAIIGAGYMGSAMSWPLSDNGYKVNLVGTHLDEEIINSCKSTGFHPRLKRNIPDNVRPFYIQEIEAAMECVDFIICGVNSMGIHWIGKCLSPFLNEDTKIISITKGIESDKDGNLQILPKVLCSEMPENLTSKISITAVGGPCIASELADRRQSCVYFGCREIENAHYFAEIFQTDYYHICTTNDIDSLEIAAALKNAYATGVSLAQGILEKSGGIDKADVYMYNLAAALFTQSCKEISILLKSLNWNPSFAYSLAGLGDLYVTCQRGRSSRLGKWLGMGLSYQDAIKKLKGETLEAAYIIQQIESALPYLESKTGINRKKMPLMYLLIDTIVYGKKVKIPIEKFNLNI